MIRTLESWDQSLFKVLNGTHNEFLDFLMPWISNKFVWIPLYALILYGLIKYSEYSFIQIIIGIGILIFFSDYVASGIFKPYFERLRPCYEPELEGMVRLLKGCGSQYGFASSHSSNSFAVAIFTWLLLKDKISSVIWLIPWAVIIAYSRIYLGVHYPGDVIVGAVIGCTAALLSTSLLTIFIKQKRKRVNG